MAVDWRTGGWEGSRAGGVTLTVAHLHNHGHSSLPGRFWLAIVASNATGLRFWQIDNQHTITPLPFPPSCGVRHEISMWSPIISTFSFLMLVTISLVWDSHQKSKSNHLKIWKWNCNQFQIFFKHLPRMCVEIPWWSSRHFFSQDLEQIHTHFFVFGGEGRKTKKKTQIKMAYGLTSGSSVADQWKINKMKWHFIHLPGNWKDARSLADESHVMAPYLSPRYSFSTTMSGNSLTWEHPDRPNAGGAAHLFRYGFLHLRLWN